ncbi:MAG: FtsX-like permease family protein [Bacteroidetes bacterium]|nr:FtsX-like permease family protein [Bacteroidota bacterium]
MDVLQEQDPGFDAEGLVEITNGAALVGARSDGGGREVGASQAFQRELLRSPNVEAVTSGPQFLRAREYPLTFRRTDIAEEPTVEAARHVISPNGLEVLGVDVQAGRYFEMPAANRPDSVAVVSPRVMEALGCDAQRLGPDCQVRLDEGTEVDASLPVVGVVDNVRFGSASNSDVPAVFYLVEQARRGPQYWHDVFVRFRDGVSRREQIATLEAAWTAFVPDRPMQYEVLTERIEAFYAQDRRLRTLSLALTGVVLVLVVLGLLAITAYLTRLRLKEVAIRKALGATIPSVLALLNREFVTLVGVAFVIGSAAAYIGMSRWLEGFATRIAPSPLVFLGMGVAALVLALGAVTWQSLPAARVDPARVLRAE